MINEYRLLVDRYERKKPLGKFRREWEDNIEIHVELHMTMWIAFMWLRSFHLQAPMNTVIELRVTYVMEFLDQLSDC
jgi:hypothetical protein